MDQFGRDQRHCWRRTCGPVLMTSQNPSSKLLRISTSTILTTVDFATAGNWPHQFEKVGRGEWIRTTGLLVPNQALYQAEPRPDSGGDF